MVLIARKASAEEVMAHNVLLALRASVELTSSSSRWPSSALRAAAS
jgi:hypothetical protein